jgi:site-specific recombinase XerD
MPTALEAISREHLEEWLIAMREAGRKPTTLAARYRSVHQLFRWALDEGLISRSSMTSMRPQRAGRPRQRRLRRGSTGFGRRVLRTAMSSLVRPVFTLAG